MCDLTNCWGHVGTEATELENPERPSSSPLLRGPAYSLAPAGKGVQPVWESLDPDLALLQQGPNTLELSAYRKEPNPETLAFLTLSLGPSHCLPALGCALPAL